MTPHEPDSDDTAGLEDARKALRESRRRSRTNEVLTHEVSNQVSYIREIRQKNHFADHFRDILRGNT